MKIYLDFVFFINFGFDFLLLMIVCLVLKRRIKILRILFGSFIGSLSIFSLFMPLNSFTLFLLKIVVSILMVLITFGKKQFFKTILYLYFASILLGGFLYFINLQFSYKNEGLIFFYNGFHLNILLLFILSPIIFYCYYKQSRYFHDTLSNIHLVDIYYQGKVYSYQGYLDTGNQLRDPYKNREVTLVYEKKLYDSLEKYLPIPFETLSSTGVLKGVIAEKIVIDKVHEFSNVLLGISGKSFSLENSDVILHGNFKNKI